MCDFLGGRLASFFGITTPKYQLEIEERLKMIQEEREERASEVQNLKSWSNMSGKYENRQSFMERGDFENDELPVSRQPTKWSGSGDAYQATHI